MEQIRHFSFLFTFCFLGPPQSLLPDSRFHTQCWGSNSVWWQTRQIPLYYLFDTDRTLYSISFYCCFDKGVIPSGIFRTYSYLAQGSLLTVFRGPCSAGGHNLDLLKANSLDSLWSPSRAFCYADFLYQGTSFETKGIWYNLFCKIIIRGPEW